MRFCLADLSPTGTVSHQVVLGSFDRKLRMWESSAILIASNNHPIQRLKEVNLAESAAVISQSQVALITESLCALALRLIFSFKFTS